MVTYYNIGEVKTMQIKFITEDEEVQNMIRIIDEVTRQVEAGEIEHEVATAIMNTVSKRLDQIR
jgi:hypothetical protein